MTNLESKPIGPGDYGSCPACNRQKTDKNWCSKCHPELLLNENPGWTSGYKDLDDFIKQTIRDARCSYGYLEWIPFENFKVIKEIGKGGFATAYLATRTNCLNVHFTWDVKKKKYFRENYKDYNIALKCFHNKKGIAEAILHEIKTHHGFMMRQENGFLHCYGISKNPKTNELIIVLDYAQEESDIYQEFKTADENITSEDDNKDEIEFMCKVAKIIS
ncbi:14845_t:CDS:2, partial [Dentiscutata erythropus]